MTSIPRQAPRRAFTLIELLVVIAIIAALLALSAAATIRFIGTQQTNNTKSELSRTQAQLNRLYSAVKDTAYKNPQWKTEMVPGTSTTVESFILSKLAGTDANAKARALVIYVKLKLLQAFPMNFDEAIKPYPLPPLPAYKLYLNSLGVTGSTKADYESSACLLMALQRAVSNQGVDLADLGGGSVVAQYPTANATIPALVDAWGTPLAFTRAPTGSIVLNPNGAQTGANDPTDPQGLLNSGAWQPQSMRTYFFRLIQQEMAPSLGMSYRIAPMIASAGQDKKWQINTINFKPKTVGATGDDLFSNP
jgi:prepilin-type N-terminal cleavage/methylation domain-containing protein